MSDIRLPEVGEQFSWKLAMMAMRNSGVALLPGFPAIRIGETVAYLQQSAVYNAHVAAKATERASYREAVSRRWPMFCSSLDSCVCAPHLFEAAIGLLPFAREYFGGEDPLLYSMNAFWTQPSDAPEYQDTHGWHRDGDDRKQLVMFVYGANVLRDEDGAHLYQGGTQDTTDEGLGRDFRAPRPEEVIHVHGPRGMIFLADTRGLHMGLRPRTGLRMLMWARFGVSDPPESYVHDRLAPVNRAFLGSRYPDDEETRRAIRLVAA